jgi:hypothetical protein
MSTVMVIRGGKASMVYDDRWRPLMEALGTIEVTRATKIEFDAPTGQWVATYIPTGQEIGRDRNRGNLIAAEVAWLETNVIRR